MKHPKRYLAVDLGDRRIGLAAGSLEARLAQPLEVLDRAGDEGDARVFRRLRELVKREDIGWIVVGDPVNMDGTAGPRAEMSRNFAGRLQKALRQVRVELHDERLSSFAADEWMDRDGVKPAQRKTRRDAYAAAVILMDYFEHKDEVGRMKDEGGRMKDEI